MNQDSSCSQTPTPAEPNFEQTPVLQPAAVPVRYGWGAAILAAVVIFLVYFAMTFTSTLWDRDEVIFARGAVEMLQSGNYLYPTFNFKLRPDKPMFMYWIMGLPIALLGSAEWVCRIWSPLATAVSCLLIYAIARRLLDARTGLLAMLVFAAGLSIAMVATAATADAVIVAMGLGVMALAAAIISGEKTRWWQWVLVVALLAAAMLAKSMFGFWPIAGIGGIVLLNTFMRPKALLGWRHLGLFILAAGAAAAIFLAWFIPANNATNGEFLTGHFGRHVLQRATSAMESHGGSGWKYFALLPTYVVVIYAGFFPWTLYVPAGLSALAGGRMGGNRGRVFLLGWIIALFLAVTLMPTKLQNYIIFVLPPLAMLVAGAVCAAQAGTLGDRDRRWLKAGPWLIAPVGFGLAGACFLWAAAVGVVALLQALGLSVPRFVGPWFLPSASGVFIVPALVAGAIMLAMTLGAMWSFRAGRHTRTAAILLIGMLGMDLAVAGLVVPVVEKYKTSAPLAKQIRERVPAGVPILLRNHDEPSLTFYLDRRTTPCGDVLAAKWLKGDEPGVLVIRRERLDEILKNNNLESPPVVASQSGLDYVHGKWEDLVAVEKK